MKHKAEKSCSDQVQAEKMLQTNVTHEVHQSHKKQEVTLIFPGTNICEGNK